MPLQALWAPILRVLAFPENLRALNCKRPLRTKKSTVPESVLFCYRFLFLGKQAILSTLRSVLLLPKLFFSQRSEFALRTIFCTEGFFG